LLKVLRVGDLKIRKFEFGIGPLNLNFIKLFYGMKKLNN